MTENETRTPNTSDKLPEQMVADGKSEQSTDTIDFRDANNVIGWMQALCELDKNEYLQSLSPLALAFHKELWTREIISTHHLSIFNPAIYEYYRSKRACEAAKRASLQQEYKKAFDFFSKNSPVCIAREAAEYYSEMIDDCITPVMDALNAYCKQCQCESIYQKILNLAQNSKEFLLQKFYQELDSDPTYYSMYKLEYFLDKTPTEKWDARLEEDGFLFRLLDAIVSEDAITYSFSSGAIKVLQEMEDDLNRKCSTFYRRAHNVYENYTRKIEHLVDSIGRGLPGFEEGEQITQYLRRMTTRKAG